MVPLKMIRKTAMMALFVMCDRAVWQEAASTPLQVGRYRSSTSAGAIAGKRSALALNRRGSFTHSTRHP